MHAHTVQKNYESVISQYKKKLEDAGELRKQVKATEEKNMIYVQQNLDLEEVGHVIWHIMWYMWHVMWLYNPQELRRLTGVRSQLDGQRKAVCWCIRAVLLAFDARVLHCRYKNLRTNWHRKNYAVWRSVCVCVVWRVDTVLTRQATEEAEDKGSVVSTLTAELIVRPPPPHIHTPHTPAHTHSKWSVRETLWLCKYQAPHWLESVSDVMRDFPHTPLHPLTQLPCFLSPVSNEHLSLTSLTLEACQVGWVYTKHSLQNWKRKWLN